MSVEHVEVLVEEPSMEAALRILLPNVLRRKSFEVYAYQGKQNLLKRLPERLSGYASWLPRNWRIVVIVDLDNDDCYQLKAHLDRAASNAGLITRTVSMGSRWQVLNRLAIEELESWYFGDWEAVQAAYPKVPPTISSQAKYRNPDAIAGGTSQAFERILRRAGYFAGGLRKIEVARAVAQYMRPERNTSHSFRVLLSALGEMDPPNGLFDWRGACCDSSHAG